MLQLIDKKLIDDVCLQASKTSRLRMNYNLHEDLEDKCQRLLNAMQPGTKMPIHHHKVAEVYIVLQGKLRTMIYDDNGNTIDEVIVDRKKGNFGVQIPANTWHSIEVLEKDTVIFEVKEGPFIPHEISGILEISKQ